MGSVCKVCDELIDNPGDHADLRECIKVLVQRLRDHQGCVVHGEENIR